MLAQFKTSTTVGWSLLLCTKKVQKGRGFNSRLGNKRRLWFLSPVCILETTDQCFPLTLFLSLPLSKTYPRVRIKKKRKAFKMIRRKERTLGLTELKTLNLKTTMPCRFKKGVEEERVKKWKHEPLFTQLLSFHTSEKA